MNVMHFLTLKPGAGTARAAFMVVALALGLLLYPCTTHGQCIDYGNHLQWVGGVETPGDAYGLAVSGSYAYIADADSGLQVVDLSNPAAPVIVGGVNTPDWAALWKSSSDILRSSLSASSVSMRYVLPSYVNELICHTCLLKSSNESEARFSSASNSLMR